MRKLPGACCRGVEGGAGENQGCGEATSNQCRGRSMSEVHSEVRETHSRVGCGTRRRGSRSQGSEGSPLKVGGRASTAARSQCAPGLGSRDLFRSTEVAGIGCPVAVPTCAGCRSNTNDSGHTQFQARSIARRFRAFMCRGDASSGSGTVNKRQAGGGGEDLPVDHPRCPRVARSSSRTTTVGSAPCLPSTVGLMVR